ncbi:MAG: undecaprenyldiphospho-muramoylpentapeptide beta-N-acetylglucosaminyltransferase [Spirochaetales bacterium]|nr:undecaprenyldiphospho-muramoylpentapeptide beta-N-acetylglucosaminyltransferase [Spirochaetales bacterium]
MQVIVFTGGGTGGHVYPGLAVLAQLKQLTSARLLWIGSHDGLEKTLVEQAGVEFYGIPSGKLRRYLSFKNLTDLFKILHGYFAARKLLKRFKPCVVFSKGGFVSVPPVWAARSLKIPVVSHESDFDPGLATKLNLKSSRWVCVPYPESVQHFPASVHERLLVTGNPVRFEFSQANPEALRQAWSLPQGVPVVVVLGGSLGAVQINELIKARLEQWAGKVFVIHQTGKDWTPPADTAWYRSRPFFTTEMPDLYACADVVLGRAGAGTLWEACAVGVPLLLIPLEVGSRGDQVRNAQYFSNRGAAEQWTPREGEAQFDRKLQDLLDHPEKRTKMKNAQKAFAGAQATTVIAKRILSCMETEPLVR